MEHIRLICWAIGGAFLIAAVCQMYTGRTGR